MGRTVVLTYGFRPFFLLAGIYAVAPMAAWLLSYAGVFGLPGSLGGSLWHGHEMVFGFAAAAITGFLLTAVPSWTGTERVQGVRLGLIAGVWAVGRIAWWLADVLPPAVVAVLDLALFPLLLAMIAPPILRARRPRNYPVPLVLVGLLVANLLVHLAVLGVISTSVRTGLYLGVYLVVLLVVLVGGRITPAFTANARASAGPLRSSSPNAAPSAALAVAAFAAVAVALGADLTAPQSLPAAIAAFAAALILAVRLATWRGTSTWRQPILWVLHVAYAWVVLGLLLLGLAQLDRIPPTAALHALTSGAIGTMVLAVMSRAALGHTGRPLVTPRPVVLAYGLVILGAALRTVGPILAGSGYRLWITVGGVLWTLGYAIFVVAYAPILLSPRVDGKPG